MPNSRHPFLRSGVRLIVAVILSALTVVPLYLVLAISTGDFYNALLLPVLVVATMCAFAGVLFVGLPVHFLLRARAMKRPIHYAVPGFAAPALFVAISQPFGLDGPVFVFLQAILMGLFGASVALVFRFIALGQERAN